MDKETNYKDEMTKRERKKRIKQGLHDWERRNKPPPLNNIAGLFKALAWEIKRGKEKKRLNKLFKKLRK